MEIISVTNHKGGVGKTTLTQQLAVGLVHTGNKVLCIDADSSVNLTFISGAMEAEKTLYEVMTGEATAKEAIIKTKLKYDLIAGNELLGTADKTFTNYSYFKKSLAPIINDYDYILIDTPPHIGVLLFNALATSSKVIIPTNASALNILGLTQLLCAINTVKQNSMADGGNPYLQIEGIVLNMYTDRKTLSRGIREVLTDQVKAFDTKVFKTRIRNGAPLEKAQFYQVDIFEAYPKENITQDIKDFVKELTGKKVK